MHNAYKAISVLFLGASGCTRTVIVGGPSTGQTYEPITSESCGGSADAPCAEGTVCVDDPSDDCEPKSGRADCPGICAEEEPPPAAIACGGFAGFPCPKDLLCVDDPSDGCDPQQGGADCMGICVSP
jgi:hypothetical protein